jgi:hypothetical protein
MARKFYHLTARDVETLTKPGRHADGQNLYLSISKDGGSRRWVFLYRWRGKPTELGFGSARLRASTAGIELRARSLRLSFGAAQMPPSMPARWPSTSAVCRGAMSWQGSRQRTVSTSPHGGRRSRRFTPRSRTPSRPALYAHRSGERRPAAESFANGSYLASLAIPLVTLPVCRPSRGASREVSVRLRGSDVGSKAENICSHRAFRILTQNGLQQPD